MELPLSVTLALRMLIFIEEFLKNLFYFQFLSTEALFKVWYHNSL